MTQVKHVTDLIGKISSAALVEQSAAAESLRQQADHLVGAVGVFRLPSQPA